MRETFFLLLSIGFLLTGSAHLGVSTASIVPNTDTVATVQAEETEDIHSHSHSHDDEQHAVAGLAQKRRMQRLSRLQQSFKPAIQPQPAIYPSINKPDILMKHRIISSDTLSKMPERCHKFLENFFVRYDNPEHRGLGGKSTIILTGGVEDDEFRALFIHEFGHMLDLGCLAGTPDAGVSVYRDGSDIMYNNDPSVSFYAISWTADNKHKDGITDRDFVSGYASWDMFEDFSESFTYYALHRRAFYNRALENPVLAAKYNWFVHNLPDLRIASQSEHVWNGHIPWDTTKLAYNWIN